MDKARWLVKKFLDKIANCRLLFAIFIAFVVLISRLPFLRFGYGSDTDAWRVKVAATHLATTGVYIPSRPPGYPLPEYIDAGILKLGLTEPFWIALPSVIASVAAVMLLMRLLRPLGLVRATLAACAFAFTPAVFIASIGPMDYMVGAAFFLAALVAAFERRTIIAAIMLGFAAASRTTYALAIIPVCLATLQGDFSRKALRDAMPRFALLSALSGGVAIIFYLPLIAQFGFSWLTFSDHKFLPFTFFENMTWPLFGKIGTLAVCGGTIFSIRNYKLFLLNFNKFRPILYILILTTFLYVMIYARLTDQAFYLIPALFGIYAFIFSAVPKAGSATILAALFVSCFVPTPARDHESHLRMKLGPVLDEAAISGRYRCMARVARLALDRADRYTLLYTGGGLPPKKWSIPYVGLRTILDGWKDGKEASQT